MTICPSCHYPNMVENRCSRCHFIVPQRLIDESSRAAEHSAEELERKVSPSASRMSWILKELRKGRHILLEKNYLNTVECRNVIKAIAETIRDMAVNATIKPAFPLDIDKEDAKELGKLFKGLAEEIQREPSSIDSVDIGKAMHEAERENDEELAEVFDFAGQCINETKENQLMIISDLLAVSLASKFSLIKRDELVVISAFLLEYL